MTNTNDPDFIELTQQLLLCIAAGDWDTYERLCDPSLTAFEPEARGQLVQGMEFHKFYFDLPRDSSASQTSIIAPHVRRLGDDVAVVSYVRLMQHADAHNQPHTACFEETRVWQRIDRQWRHVHFHRSCN